MRIKICGMSEQTLIDEAAALGVEMCGFVFHAPSPRNVTAHEVAALDTHGMKRTGVFVRQSAEEIRNIVREAGLDLIQLHGGQSAEFAARFPAEKVIRVLWPGQLASTAELQRAIDAFAGTCGLYLLDAGMGSGRQLDWPSLRALRFPHPWFLSGGLGPDDVERALSACSPDGLDFNSRLETSPGKKNGELMERAVAAVRAQERARRNRDMDGQEGDER
ncbi:phosphoribosylanthranilate isomerase [uncultured Mailhella sp.]|uniref:phosphoribosylanthranilate isomerase n=1 Tax=uncultured Mailhella sp. TaxID=1981031 RepID=UPI0025D524B6|nr:phosphoribosylanthranilate isomerase [uncultured Mailhella sp.]